MSLSTHPRRSAKLASPPSLHINPLRKSDTFSARTGLRSSLFNPKDNAPLRPTRSPTSLDENFVVGQAQLAATRQEIVDRYLREVDVALQRESPESSLKFLNNQHVLAVPSAVADQIIIPDQMDIDEKKPINEHHHCSDSGLGSSVDTPHQDTQTSVSVLSSATTAPTVRSAITKSFSADSINPQNTGPALSVNGLKHIQESILDPLLANLDLKDFHPLIAAVPGQAQAKIISNLRDLEKQFLYGAPINRYAAIMRQTRERQERGEPADDMDYSPDETLTIQGGLGVNGRPAEIVRTKNGKAISLIPEEARSQIGGIMASKRAFQDDTDDSDDDVLRSMARRRKSDKAGDVVHACSECRKEFKRPCDLTKHEKTHSRPFKCSEPSCRYHELGWPTEKERDRHVNDKHSDAPKMYHCQYAPCSYSSKRESNCKQHMEKAHNWQYIRSKSNGRKRAATESGAAMTPPTPVTPFSIESGYTPQSHLAQSPYTGHVQQYTGESSRSPAVYSSGDRRNSGATSCTEPSYASSSGFSPAMIDFESKFPINPSPADSYLTPDFGMAQATSPMFNHGLPLHYNTGPLGPFSTSIMTPSTMAAYNHNNVLPALTMEPNYQFAMQPSHFSPTGQDMTLFSTEVDETYGGAEAGMLDDDFVLFPTSAMDTTASTNNWAMDNGMNSFGGQFDPCDNPSMFPSQ